MRSTLLLALSLVGAALLASPVGANPPFPSSTYNLYANNALIGVLHIPANGDQQGASLGAGSYVDAPCVNGGSTVLFTAHIDLSNVPINNPAGVINAFPSATKVPNYPGTLSNPRFFIRWYPSVSGAPTQTPPQGPPGPGQTFASPAPGDIGTGNVSGRNNPPNASDQSGFCSFNLNFFAQKQ